MQACSLRQGVFVELNKDPEFEMTGYNNVVLVEKA